MRAEDRQKTQANSLACVAKGHQVTLEEEIKVLQKLDGSGEVTSRHKTRQRNQAMKRSSCLYKLDPFIDDKGQVRVGGRLRKADVPFEVRHPIIMPRKAT